MHDVVITGTSLLSAAGHLEATWRALLKKRTRHKPCTSTTGIRACTCELGDHFAAHTSNLPPKIRTLDRSVQAAVAVSDAAIRDADLVEVSGDKTGVFVGSSRFTDHTKSAYQHTLNIGGLLPRDALIQSLALAPAFWVAKHFGITGVTEMVSSACTGSLQALMDACNQLKLGYIQKAIVIGVETSLTELCVEQFAQLGVCSPSSRCLPFDRARDGTIPGEGAAALVLETFDHAHSRRARVIARVRGYASVNDGFAYANDPSGSGIQRAIETALHRAWLMPQEISVANVHAPGTVAGDIGEGKALERLLSRGTPVYSVKPLIGHCNGAASAMELVLGLQGMVSETVPGNYLSEQDPACGNIFLPREPLHREQKLLLKTSSGIGGVHAAALFSSV